MPAQLKANADINIVKSTLFRLCFITLNFHSNFESQCINKFLLGFLMESQLQARTFMTPTKERRSSFSIYLLTQKKTELVKACFCELLI